MIPEELIPDASVLFSFFKSNSVRRRIFKELLKHDCVFFAPAFLFEELTSDKNKIMKFAGIDEKEFSYLFRLLEREIKQLPKEEYEDKLALARATSPDSKDVPYFALALARNIPIWSDEKSFATQHKIKVFSTKDLLKLLSLTE